MLEIQYPYRVLNYTPVRQVDTLAPWAPKGELGCMPKRSSKPVRDENVAAYEAVKRLTGSEGAPEATDEERSQIARLLGARGGRKGGKARAAALTPEQRKAIAKQAAETRWAREKGRKADP